MARLRPQAASEANTPTAIQVGLFVALILSATLLSLSGYQSFQLGVYRDDSDYTLIAQYLANPGKYVSMNPAVQAAEAKFPIGYPLLLSPLAHLFPNNLDVLKIPSVLATLLNAALVFFGWRYFSRRKSYWWGLGIAALYLVSPLTIDHTHMVMSEPVFTFFVLTSLLLAEQMVTGSAGRWWTIALSLSLFFATITRSIGLVLLLGILAYLLLVKGRAIGKQLTLVILGMLVLAGAVMIFMPIQAENFLPWRYFNSLGSGRSQSTAYPVASQVPVANIPIPTWRLRFIQANFLRDIPGVIVPFQGSLVEELAQRTAISALASVLGLFVIVLVAVGYFRWMRTEGLSFIRLFPILYLGVLLVWIWNDTRLLYPIQMQLDLAFLLGIEALLIPLGLLANKRPGPLQLGNVLIVASVIALLATSTYKSFRIEDTRLHVGDVSARTQWLRSDAAPSDTIMTEEPDTDSLYSGRMTVPYPASCSSPSEFQNYLAAKNVTYVLVAPKVGWQSRYTPLYSNRALSMLACLQGLGANGRAELIFASGTDLVQVFKTVP